MLHEHRAEGGNSEEGEARRSLRHIPFSKTTPPKPPKPDQVFTWVSLAGGQRAGRKGGSSPNHHSWDLTSMAIGPLVCFLRFR